MFYSCFFIFQWLMETTGASLILVSTLWQSLRKVTFLPPAPARSCTTTTPRFVTSASRRYQHESRKRFYPKENWPRICSSGSGSYVYVSSVSPPKQSTRGVQQLLQNKSRRCDETMMLMRKQVFTWTVLCSHWILVIWNFFSKIMFCKNFHSVWWKVQPLQYSPLQPLGVYNIFPHPVSNVSFS